MIRIAVQFARPGFTLDVSIQTDAHVTGVFGPSGAGKTTLISLLAGLEHPNRGAIEIDGEPLFDSQRGINVPTHRRRVGVVFQEHRLFPHLSVKGNLVYGRPRGDHDDGEFARAVDLLELGPFLDRCITDLSGGERQRVALGRALISRPRLLLLDEPLASLDLRLKRQILPYLLRVRDASSTPMLYVSHDLSELLQLTDHLTVLDKGSLVGHGRYTDLVHDTAVLPVVHDRGMSNVLAATVLRHEPADGVSVLGLGDGDARRQLIVPKCPAPPGARVTIAVQPSDIALATTELPSVSIQNQIRSVVTRCSLHDDRAIVGVDLGAPVIVEVSKRAAASLALAPGRPVVCLIKSHAIRHVGGGS